ncbi:MAG: YvrJ family protein [Niameybacter sp.]
MNELLSQIGNFGFPIILSMYLLIRIESKMESLSHTIQQLSKVLDKREQS